MKGKIGSGKIVLIVVILIILIVGLVIADFASQEGDYDDDDDELIDIDVHKSRYTPSSRSYASSSRARGPSSGGK